MDIDIKPLVGVGPLRFGMSVDEVRAMLGVHYVSFKKTPLSEFPCDHFEDSSTFAYYDKNGKLEALEFYEGANPVLNGYSFMGGLASEAKLRLDESGGTLEIDSDSITSLSLGVGVYAPDWEQDASQTVEGVIVFKEGYYL